MPAIVALVARNVVSERRPAAYGLIAAAAAIAIAVGPIVGGFATTYFSWRWVFAGEAIIVLAILLLSRRIADSPAEGRTRIDVVGAALSIVGLSALVFGVLRSSEWGWIQPKAGVPVWLKLSPVVWLLLGALLVIWLFFRWEARRERTGAEPLLRVSMLRNRQLNGGPTMFFFQFLVQAGVFFTVPLFHTVVLGLSALATGARLAPALACAADRRGRDPAPASPRLTAGRGPRRADRRDARDRCAGGRHRRRRGARGRRRAAGAHRAGDRRSSAR
jgi:MFS family permease